MLQARLLVVSCTHLLLDSPGVALLRTPSPDLYLELLTGESLSQELLSVAHAQGARGQGVGTCAEVFQDVLRFEKG